MRLEIQQRLPGHRLLWTDGVTSYLARGMSFFGLDPDNRITMPYYAIGNRREHLLAGFRLSRQLFRLGIHHLWPLRGGAFLVVAKKRIYRVTPDGLAEIVFRIPRGNKPAHKGVCVTPHGDVFLGEYALNGERCLPVTLYRSRDGGRVFTPVYEFAPGVVRHIHFVQWDPFAQCLWMGTGDHDHESGIYRSTDIGESWEQVGGGSQLWRAIGVAFRSEAIFWGTDAGSDAGVHPNYVMRLNRATWALDKVLEIQGPCHGSTVLKDRTLLVSTGVEGGANERDRYAHLWASRDGVSWQELIQYRKDYRPYIVQFGVIRFPNGLKANNRVAFTTLGLADDGETIVIGQLKD
jgi:hypothetical protein